MIYDYVITKPPLDKDTLAHYGVKGMKWRRRKNKKTSKWKKDYTGEYRRKFTDEEKGDPRQETIRRQNLATNREWIMPENGLNPWKKYRYISKVPRWLR